MSGVVCDVRLVGVIFVALRFFSLCLCVCVVFALLMMDVDCEERF